MKPLTIVFMLFLCAVGHSNAQTPLWTQVATGSANTEGMDIAIDQGGNVFVAGFYTGAPVFGTDTVPNGSGILIVKYDSLGNLLWLRNAAMPTAGSCYASKLSVDQWGNVYLSGAFFNEPLIIGADTLHNVSPGGTGGDYFILKFNSVGKLCYAKNGGSVYAPYLNFPMANDAAGNLYFCGNFYCPQIVFGPDTLVNASEPAHTQVFLVKFDSVGNTIWAKTAPGTSDAYQSAITISPDGNILVAGLFSEGALIFGPDSLVGSAGTSLFLAKYDVSGNNIWAKHIAENIAMPPVIPALPSLITGITTDYQGSIYVAGGFMSALKIDSISLTEDPGPTYGNSGGYYAKFDNTGSFLWAKSITGSVASYGETVWGIAHDPNNNNVIISGGFDCSSFSIGDAGFTNPDVSDEDASFVVEIDSTGSLICGSAFNGGGDDCIAAATDREGHIYLGGDFIASPFQIGSEIFYPGSGGEKLFVTKFDPCPGTTTEVHNTPVKNEIEVFPSPTSDVVNIRNAQNEHLEIYDLMGVAVISQKIFSETETVNVADLPDGLYIVQITDASGAKTVRKIEKASLR